MSDSDSSTMPQSPPKLPRIEHFEIIQGSDKSNDLARYLIPKFPTKYLNIMRQYGTVELIKDESVFIIVLIVFHPSSKPNQHP